VTGFLRWQDLLDIFIVAFVIYRVFLLMKGTRAVQLVVGLIIVLFAFYVAKQLDLFTLGWILNNFVASILLVIVVVFQNEIRRVLFALGRSPFLSKITYVEETLFYDELVNACVAMSARRVGALIVVEREAGLDEFVEIGVKLDAEVNAELVVSLFQPRSPLHDGALIIKEGRIRAGSCVLPLTMKEGIDKGLGTRHRAAIGITEVSDSIAVVVSEETGKISYAVRGDIVRPVNGEELKKALKELLGARK
jgi:diadenylate cyclase